MYPGTHILWFVLSKPRTSVRRCVSAVGEVPRVGGTYTVHRIETHKRSMHAGQEGLNTAPASYLILASR